MGTLGKGPVVVGALRSVARVSICCTTIDYRNTYSLHIAPSS